MERVFARTGTAGVAADPMPPKLSDAYGLLKARDHRPAPRRTRGQPIAAVQAAVQRLHGQGHGFSQPIQWRFNEFISGARADASTSA